MHDESCVVFLQWALPRLHMQWSGYRRVYAQVCKRIRRRVRQLGLQDLSAYAPYLAHNETEWAVLDAMVRVTISRFYRDKMMFAFLQQQVLPILARQALAAQEECLNIWSIGCGSGEEPYTLAIIWKLCLQSVFPQLPLRVLATDANAQLCERARQACYQYSSIKNLPADWRDRVFDRHADRYQLKTEYRNCCRFRTQDVRTSMPTETFHLVLCRNLVFTYFDPALQYDCIERIKKLIRPAGALVLGIHESLPQGTEGFTVWQEKLRIYGRNPRRRIGSTVSSNPKLSS